MVGQECSEYQVFAKLFKLVGMEQSTRIDHNWVSVIGTRRRRHNSSIDPLLVFRLSSETRHDYASKGFCVYKSRCSILISKNRDRNDLSLARSRGVYNLRIEKYEGF